MRLGEWEGKRMVVTGGGRRVEGATEGWVDVTASCPTDSQRGSVGLARTAGAAAPIIIVSEDPALVPIGQFLR